MFWFLLVLPVPLFARLCVDDQKGWCQGHEIWGWCFHNKTDGRFDCDEANFCVGQETLKNKKNSGCFNRNNNTVCCCNDADGCNLGFIQSPPKYVASQQCYNSVEEPGEDIRLFKPCDDPWCFAFLSTDAEGGLTSVVRGCHSRKMVMHQMFLQEDQKFNNNSRWQDTKDMAEQPSCEDIAGMAERINGTQGMCFDFEFEGEDGPKKGRLCCCQGENKCNEKFAWGDEAITKEELEQMKLERLGLTGSTSKIASGVLLLVLMGVLRS